MTPTERAAVVAETEAAIVAWLREGEDCEDCQEIWCIEMRGTMSALADQIERGEYRGVK